MEDLIKALQIFLKYGNPQWPTHCDHDILMISPDINPANVSEIDKDELKILGFFISNEGAKNLLYLIVLEVVNLSRKSLKNCCPLKGN